MRGILRVRVGGERSLAQKGLIVRGRDHLERGGFWICAVDVVAADDDVFESLLLPFIGDVVGEFVVAFRSGDVRLLREDAVLAAFFVGRGDGFEFVFDFGFVGGGGGGEAEDGLGGGAVRAEREEQGRVRGHVALWTQHANGVRSVIVNVDASRREGPYDQEGLRS